MRHSKWAATRAVFPAAVATAVRASLATDRPTTAYIQPVVRTALSDARSIELENYSIRYDATKMLSVSGGASPPDQGLCPWTPLGALPADPHYVIVIRHHKTVKSINCTGITIYTLSRPPGRPRNKWLDQLRNDSTRQTGELWRRAVDRGRTI